VAWGRQFWLYGPGETSGRLVSDVAKSLIAGKEVEVGEGLQRRDFIHVDDVAGAFVAALLSDYAGAFNIGSGSAGRVRDIVGRLAEISGRPDLIRWGAKPTPANEPPLIEADIATLKSRIGFSPSITLDDGLARTYQFWRDRQAHDEFGQE
jgi:nucleoside-diphosphate-sugar epimerase